MDEFDRYRAAMNEKLLGSNHLGIKRFFALDTQAYEDGALDKRTKELMGLVASAVLRCDDCITYHIKQCAAIGINREEFLDAFNVALVVGGSITIPHLRRAIERVDQLLENQSASIRENCVHNTSTYSDGSRCLHVCTRKTTRPRPGNHRRSRLAEY